MEPSGPLENFSGERFHGFLGVFRICRTGLHHDLDDWRAKRATATSQKEFSLAISATIGRSVNLIPIEKELRLPVSHHVLELRFILRRVGVQRNVLWVSELVAACRVADVRGMGQAGYVVGLPKTATWTETTPPR